MRRALILLSGILLVGFSAVLAQQKLTQDKPKEGQTTDSAPSAIPAEAKDKVNPVKSTPEGVASVVKLYGYHCAMCHGKEGDGKGDLAVDMKLNLHDWRDADAIAKMSDGELFYIITNGKGKMTGGEGDRTKEEVRWNLVNLVRSFGKKAAQ
jgi:mono/diheme cytochrome c family protein